MEYMTPPERSPNRLERIDEIVESSGPLSGEDHKLLREWVSSWRFDIRDFSERAQILVRGDITALQEDYENQIMHYMQLLYTEEGAITAAAKDYIEMCETRVKMPAMEVVVAGAQYFDINTSTSMSLSNTTETSVSPSTESITDAKLSELSLTMFGAHETPFDTNTSTIVEHFTSINLASHADILSHFDYPNLECSIANTATIERVTTTQYKARMSDHIACIHFLYSIGVPVDAEDVAGFTAFMRASQTSKSRLDLAAHLLVLGADINHRSRFGGVVLHEAIMAQDRQAITFLVRNGASMDVKDNDEVSPRDIVALVL